MLRTYHTETITADRTLPYIYVWHLEQAEIGRAVMEWYASSLERGLAMREQCPPELFVDCSQAEIAAEPIAVVERVSKPTSRQSACSAAMPAVF